MGFKMIYWTPRSGSYFLLCSILEKMWKFLEKRPFFRADMAGLGNTETESKNGCCIIITISRVYQDSKHIGVVMYFVKQ